MRFFTPTDTLHYTRGGEGGLASKTRRLIKIGRTGRSIGRIYRRIFFTADFQPNNIEIGYMCKARQRRIIARHVALETRSFPSHVNYIPTLAPLFYPGD